MSRFDHIIIFSGYLFSYGMMCLLIHAFLVAYFKESKQVVIGINSYGEANIEFVLLITLLVFNFIGLLLLLKKRKE